MSSKTDEPAAYLRLLQRAGLSRIEHMLDHNPGSLHVRLIEDNEKLKLLENLPGEEILFRLKGAAEQHTKGEITAVALRDLWPHSERGAYRSFDITRDDFGLPGKEDFDLPRREGDEDL